MAKKHSKVSTTHPQVKVDGVEVDAGLAKLLGMMWKLGFETGGSCQETEFEPDRLYGRMAYILFHEQAHAMRFLMAVNEHVPRINWTNNAFYEVFGDVTLEFPASYIPKIERLFEAVLAAQEESL